MLGSPEPARDTERYGEDTDVPFERQFLRLPEIRRSTRSQARTQAISCIFPPSRVTTAGIRMRRLRLLYTAQSHHLAAIR